MTNRSCLVVRGMVPMNRGEGFIQGAHRVVSDGNDRSQWLRLARIGL